jgi:hypothetical protein
MPGCDRTRAPILSPQKSEPRVSLRREHATSFRFSSSYPDAESARYINRILVSSEQSSFPGHRDLATALPGSVQGHSGLRAAAALRRLTFERRFHTTTVACGFCAGELCGEVSAQRLRKSKDCAAEEKPGLPLCKLFLQNDRQHPDPRSVESHRKNGESALRRADPSRGCWVRSRLDVNSDAAHHCTEAFASFRGSRVPRLAPVHHCTAIADPWPCHTLKGVGSRGRSGCALGSDPVA